MDTRPRHVPELLELILEEIPPASGAVVMGTGIVSVALALDGVQWLSLALLVIAALVWIALAWFLPARAVTDAERFEEDLGHPTSLTSVAGTGVLGTRLTLLGWDKIGAVLLVVALATWIGLVPLVLRNWKLPTIGASFILTVGTESLALLGFAISDDTHTAWLFYASLAPFVLGLGFYLYVLRSFDFKMLLHGSGAHWVTGGALAISTVAAGRLVLSADHNGLFVGGRGVLEMIALVLWCATLAWWPALMLCEGLRPRLRYTVRRWSTVFPVGMCAACSFVVGPIVGIDGITTFAQVWVWVAFALWAVVFGAMVRRIPALLRSARPARAARLGAARGA